MPQPGKNGPSHECFPMEWDLIWPMVGPAFQCGPILILNTVGGKKCLTSYEGNQPGMMSSVPISVSHYCGANKAISNVAVSVREQ